MDAKNDDSGSDSLDKSLQKKCVVDDVGQGEGASCSTESNIRRRSDTKLPQHNSIKKLKTDYGESGGGGEDIVGADDEEEPKDAELNNCEETTSKSSTSSNNTTNSNSNAFETKVTLISKNLMDTTLAEGESQRNAAAAALNDGTDAASGLDTDETATSNSAAETDKSNSICSNDTNTQEEPPPPFSSLTNTDNESFDSQDPRSKKVRFHPDVKPNDGGKRVFKKKKKRKSTTPPNDDNLASTSTGARPKRMQEEMELDDGEEEYDEEEDSAEELEEEFDLNKTIAEAKEFLKQHPLSFVRPNDNARLLEPEDLPEPEEEETEEEEDFYQNIPPENGVEKILGKLKGNGKIMYLLRYSDERGLTWESEEVISKQCPSLLEKYEQFREWRQDNLMRYVAKRQRFRQRYTDF